MITGIFDKLIFGVLCLGLMQLPLIADHYLQYLQGYTDAVSQEVRQYQALATQYNYPSVQALITEHQQSAIPSVKADAMYKQQRLAELVTLEQGLAVFKTGHLGQKIAYMVAPQHAEILRAVLPNFKPGIPLSPYYVLLCIGLALSFNVLGGACCKKLKSQTR